MAYFIFLKNSDNIEGTIYRIAENQSDLNNLNIDKSIYKIIEVSQSSFDDVKYGTKEAIKYNGEIITYLNTLVSLNKKELINYVDSFKKNINSFKENNTNHSLFDRWSNYYNQLNNLNLDNITYPLNKSLEQYFKDLGQPSLNTLQLP